MKTATHLDQHIGARIAEIREKRGLSRTKFAERVREHVGGVGWSRQASWDVERGKKALAASDLVAVAWVLECTVADIMSTSEPVSLGGEETFRTDAIVSGEEAMPEVEAWARYEEAKDALADVRHAWERYAHLIDVVRRRVADTPALKRRIEADRAKAAQTAVREMEEAFGFRRPEGFDAKAAAEMNLTPAIITALDVLGAHKVSEMEWRRRWTRRQERSTR